MFKIKKVKVRQLNWLVKDKTLYLKKDVFNLYAHLLNLAELACHGTWITIMAIAADLMSNN